ncbi:hypothetical protein HPP92_001207 [Vanilla planifolia]|uniref:Uncharacterized protein n=1 Tax=Vanilla planifolia TaxID=51239 RepID=A0A835S681_VANPL|nr:hypothetical protein HPP92_001207 [Vanilla planifolia]
MAITQHASFLVLYARRPIGVSPNILIFQSASLCLTTTTPEQLASALWWFMYPLNLFGVPVAEVIFTLLLSLRFINLAFDEASKGYLFFIILKLIKAKPFLFIHIFPFYLM